jgi:hypothetical protein
MSLECTLKKDEFELLRAEDKAQEIVNLLEGENYSFASWVLKSAEQIIQERAIIQERK